MGKTKDEPLQLAEESHSIYARFNELTEKYRQDLWHYCVYLTGSHWDGDDLFQETMIKAFGRLPQIGVHLKKPKSYLYRIATNTWIDYCRKQRVELDELKEEQETAKESPDPLDLEVALEKVTSLLPPRQAARFLLLDIFQFTAEEVAGVIRTTPGAVYASARRARHKLRTNRNNGQPVEPKERSAEHENVIQAYLKALNNGHLEDMMALLNEQIHNELIAGFEEHTKDEMRSGSMMYGLPGHHAEEIILWGKCVIVILADTHEGRALHDVQYQEIENGKIVGHKSYFFCKEFLFAAAKELGIPVQKDKYPVNWEEN